MLKKITKNNYLPYKGSTLGSIPVYADWYNTLVEEIGIQNEVLALTGDATLTESDLGKTITLDNAAGLTVTLPPASEDIVGGTFYFHILTTGTSNNYGVDAASSVDLFYGSIVIHDKDNNANDAYFVPDGSDDVHFDAATTTKGGQAGGWFTVKCIAVNKWLFNGWLVGDGTLATPFS